MAVHRLYISALVLVTLAGSAHAQITLIDHSWSMSGSTSANSWVVCTGECVDDVNYNSSNSPEFSVGGGGFGNEFAVNTADYSAVADCNQEMGNTSSGMAQGSYIAYEPTPQGDSYLWGFVYAVASLADSRAGSGTCIDTGGGDSTSQVTFDSVTRFSVDVMPVVATITYSHNIFVSSGNGISNTRSRVILTDSTHDVISSEHADPAQHVTEAVSQNYILGQGDYQLDVHGYAFDSSANNGGGVTTSSCNVTGGVTITYRSYNCVQFMRQPISTEADCGQSAQMSVEVVGDGSFSYQWRFNGDYIDGESNPSANQSVLTIDNVSAEHAGIYDCIITDLCGEHHSEFADLIVNSCYQCPADYNLDGGIDGADVEAFFADWVAAESNADTNLDGGVDGADVEYFFVVWSAGGC